MKRNQFFENRHPGIKIAFKIGVSDANRAKCKQTNECKQKITSCVKKLQFIISKNLDATLSVTGTLAPFSENYDSYNINCKKKFLKERSFRILRLVCYVT